MPSGTERPRTPTHFYSHVLLAGLEAGTVGGAAMLIWYALSSAARGRSPWGIANLIAATFHGEPAMRSGFHFATLSGMALQLVIGGVVGMLFGLALRAYARRGRVLLLGVLAGVGWYYFSYSLIWRHVNPWIPLYSPDRVILVGHVFLGGALGLFPRYLAALQPQPAAESEASAAPTGQPASPE